MTGTSPEKSTSLPMFYSSPRPLDKARDAKLRISRPVDFRFAQGTNAIPLLLDELLMASASYPIVFADAAVPIPAAVVGLQNDKNLFVNSAGQWAPGAYIPAYVRRYPFILMDDQEQKQYILCIDESAPSVGEEGEYALFDGDSPSEFTTQAMDFCAHLRKQGDVTDEFVNALKACALLVQHESHLELQDGTQMQLQGFLAIDPKRFELIPDSVFCGWRRKNWLEPIYAALFSSKRWQDLVQLATR